MNPPNNPRRPPAARAPVTAALWALSATGWTLLLLTDEAPHTRAAYLAAALLAAIGATARTIIASLRRDMARFTEELERSNNVSAELADVATAAAFREHADGAHTACCTPYPAADMGTPRPGGRSRDFYYDYVRQRILPLDEASNVVPMTRPRRNVS
jgi:hypothetical protein